MNAYARMDLCSPTTDTTARRADAASRYSRVRERHLLQLKDPEGEITSPNYPQDYPKGKTCAWHFVTTPGHRLALVSLELTDDSPSGLRRVHPGGAQHLSIRQCAGFRWGQRIGAVDWDLLRQPRAPFHCFQQQSG